MASTEPKPARLANHQRAQPMSYGIGEAVIAYKRACLSHGWQVPPDFDKMAYGDGQNGQY